MTAADGRVLPGNKFITGTGQKLGGVHPASQCARQTCVIHNPSDHAMRQFKTHWRGDRGIMERICPHGVGHPDPDDQAYLVMIGREGEGVHGCDGCCRPAAHVERALAEKRPA